MTQKLPIVEWLRSADGPGTETLRRAADLIEELAEALRPLARDRTSTEPLISHDMYITPADKLRVKANDIDQRDQQIIKARKALEKVKA